MRIACIVGTMGAITAAASPRPVIPMLLNLQCRSRVT